MKTEWNTLVYFGLLSGIPLRRKRHTVEGRVVANKFSKVVQLFAYICKNLLLWYFAFILGNAPSASGEREPQKLGGKIKKRDEEKDHSIAELGQCKRKMAKGALTIQ